MTNEQLDEFEEVLSAVRMHGSDNEYVKEIDALLTPLVKELREAREVLGLILSTDALPHWAFDAGDDDESLYDMVRRAAGKDAL